VAKVGTEGVTVEEENVVGVNGTNGLFNANVKVQEAYVLLVGRFVQGVVTSNPGVVFVMTSELFPDEDGAVLKVLVNPD
jgi:hypothetical protein